MLYLRGISYGDLAAILDFMYHGEVNVEQVELVEICSYVDATFLRFRRRS